MDGFAWFRTETNGGFLHSRKLGGAKGQMPRQYFVLKIFFWLQSLRGANKKWKYFLNDSLGGVKTEENRKP